MRKLTIEEIKPKFKERGWKLLSTEYLGSQKQLSVICPEGHETTITWNNFQRGQGCKQCAGNEKFTLKQVEQMFLDSGCELLTKHYKNNSQKLHYKCSCGKESFIKLSDFRRGSRCQNCKSETLSKLYKTPEREIQKLCEQHGCVLVRVFKQKGKTRFEYICKCGRESEAYLTNFKNCPNCWECGKEKKSGENCYMYDPDREAVAFRKRMRKTCGRMIKRFMNATGQTKTRSTHELLGYKPMDLQEHIMNHPNMINCKDKEWHVDHIFPIHAFLERGILDLRIINHLSNLQPVPDVDNLSKADKYNEKDFERWLELLTNNS